MAPYIIQVEGDGNAVAVESGEYRVIFDVISERGIGAASVTEGMDTFPPSVVLRFHLGGLEELHFIYDGVEIHISVSSNEGNSVRERLLSDSNEEGQTIPIAPDSPYWMEVSILGEDRSPATIPLVDGHIMVSVPEEFVTGPHYSIRIQWIDFYRLSKR